MTHRTSRNGRAHGRRARAIHPLHCAALPWRTRLLAVGLAVLLGGCDGGLFGTGDPDVELNAEGSAGITHGVGSDLTDGASGDIGNTDGGTTDGDQGTADGMQAPGGGDTGTTGDTGGSASGTDDGDGQTSAPLSLDLGNYTDLGLGDVPRLRMLFVDETDTLGARELAVSGLPRSDETTDEQGIARVASGSDAVAALLPGDNRLAVAISAASTTGASDGTGVVADVLVNAVSGSISTLVVATTADSGAIGAMLLPNGAPAGDTRIARARLVQLASLGDSRVSGSWQLQSAGDNPGGVDSTFENVGWMQLPPAYRDLPAGDYLLVDSSGRIASQALSLQGGAVYTLYVTPDPDAPLRLQRDDVLDGGSQ